jgi:hypothetical protein
MTQPQIGGDLLGHSCQIDRLAVHLTRCHPRQLKEIVDERAHALGARAYTLEIRLALSLEPVAIQLTE